jgi:hypothetical protein
VSVDYWLADSEARVLGPVSLEVVRDLALRGKLSDVRAVSRDGKTFVPLREMPELAAVLSQPPAAGEAVRTQAVATAQIRSWLETIKGRPTAEVFRVPAGASREAWRAAFFGLVHRYVPSRLPPDATDELRLACEDAFLVLAERMVEVERSLRTSAAPAPPSVAPTLVGRELVPSSLPAVRWRGGMIHISFMLNRGDARPFLMDPDATWKSDCLHVQSNEKVMVNTPAEVTMAFEGHVTQVHASGRVVNVRSAHPMGFSIKLLGIDETQRAVIRAWVQRAALANG